jgi:hypothetical protein
MEVQRQMQDISQSSAVGCFGLAILIYVFYTNLNLPKGLQ